MKKKVDLYLPYIVIVILSLLPSIYTYGRLAIGGDVIIPFTSGSLYKYLFHWIEVNNGEYFAINYTPYYLLLFVTEKLHLSIYSISGILLFGLNLFAGLGFYRLASYIFPSGKKANYVLPLTFYLLSPALLNGPHYLFSYATLPWIIFPFLKFYLTEKINFKDIFFLAIALFWGTMELPNPKYVFHFHLIGLVIIFFGLVIKKIKVMSLIKALPKILLYLVLTSYIWVPQIIFASNYNPRNYGVVVKNGDSSAHLANYGIDTANKIFRLHQDYVFLNSEDAIKYTKNIFVQLSLYVVPAIVIWSLLVSKKKNKKDKSTMDLLSILVIVYLFFSLGPNPPLGHIYEYFVNKITLLAFLRTTAGSVFYLSLFYSLVLTWYVANVNSYRKIILPIIYLAVLIHSWPFITGAYYKNFNDINPFTETDQRGLTLPEEYGAMLDIVNSKKLDSKTLHPDSSLTYLNTRWGLFGPVIYNFLYSNRNIGNQSIPNGISNHNVGFVYYDRSLMEYLPTPATFSGILSKGFIDFQEVDRKKYKPHFYLLGTKGSESTIEYAKVNPTQYILKLHSIPSKVELVFLENYHNLWGLYKKPPSLLQNNNDLINKANLYQPLQNNQSDQPSRNELIGYINSGWVTSLGDGRERTIDHFLLINGKKEKISSEKFSVDFVSNKYQNTIQNDNLLRENSVYSWRQNALASVKHDIFENYANNWSINVDQECTRDPDYCQKNNDGTYDLEIIVLFRPQEIYMICLVISFAATLILALFCIVKNETS